MLKRLFRFIATCFELGLGLIFMLMLLAILAVIPGLNFIALGYLFEAQARIVKSGKLRTGFIGLREAAVVGRMFLGTWLLFWPLRGLSNYIESINLVSANSEDVKNAEGILVFLTIMVVVHILWACLRGGKVRHFLWPAPIKFWKWLSSPKAFKDAMLQTKNFLIKLPVVHMFWLGLRGFTGSLLWLFIPVGLMVVASLLPPAAFILTILGGLMLGLVLMWLPFLQIHFAHQNDYRMLFSYKLVRQAFRKTPIWFALALLFLTILSLPLYLLKVEWTPREVAWLPSILFVFFIYPAKLFLAWVWQKSNKLDREASRWRIALARVLLFAIAFTYVLVIFVNQYVSWYGSLSMFEQHAFLVPVPMMHF